MFLNEIYGFEIGIIEIILFGIISFSIKMINRNLKNVDVITYYWAMFTILTGIWEICFICSYKKTNLLSIELLKNNKHVWTNNYNISYILPWKMSYIFYAEYGAYADKYYMTTLNDWSRIIEGTHAIFCGLFSLLAILYISKNMEYRYKICMGIAMGSQLMNSILYMGNYFIQCSDPSSLNYNTSIFPTGKNLSDRPFMYVNVFWTVMPLYAIINLVLFSSDKSKLNNDEQKKYIENIETKCDTLLNILKQ